MGYCGPKLWYETLRDDIVDAFIYPVCSLGYCSLHNITGYVESNIKASRLSSR
jgi:hypothetical protein